jgi:hypothetical protein
MDAPSLIEGEEPRSLSLEGDEHTPAWINDASLLQGIEDAEMICRRKTSIDCSSTSVRIIGSEIIREKTPYVVYIIKVQSGACWTVKRRYTGRAYPLNSKFYFFLYIV